MSHLLDVNLLLACAWSGHADHVRANRWLNSLAGLATAPVTQMGSLRVSLSAAYGASFGDAQTALWAILQLRSHRFLADAVPADSLQKDWFLVVRPEGGFVMVDAGSVAALEIPERPKAA